MKKYKLILDESGSFENDFEKYVIIGGLLFDEKNQECLEKIFVPFHNHICNVFGYNELHGTDNKKLYNIVAPVIGSCDLIKTVIFVIDKKESFIFKNYDKKSFKYNKAIQHLVNKLINDQILNIDDELYIKIDNINLNTKEKENLSTWIPQNIKVVKQVIEDDSKNVICLQFADVIVNGFSKKGKCKKSSDKVKMLNPIIYCFLDKTADEYVEE